MTRAGEGILVIFLAREISTVLGCGEANTEVRNGEIAMRIEVGVRMRSRTAAIRTIRCIPLSSSWSDISATASGFVDWEEKRKNGQLT